MNSKIIMSGISILSALAVMGGATFAFFSSQGTSTNNVFAAGTLGLKVDDNDEAAATTISASFGSGALAPGASSSGFVSLHNSGTLSIAEVALGANETSNNNSGTSDLADVLNMTVKTGDDNTCVSGMVDQTSAINAQIGPGSPNLTLAELNTTDYDSLPGVSVGPDKYVCMTFTMDPSAGDVYQNNSITEDFVFTGHQDVSQ